MSVFLSSCHVRLILDMCALVCLENPCLGHCDSSPNLGNVRNVISMNMDDKAQTVIHDSVQFCAENDSIILMSMRFAKKKCLV